jgi:hypothetical protein
MTNISYILIRYIRKIMGRSNNRSRGVRIKVIEEIS